MSEHGPTLARIRALFRRVPVRLLVIGWLCAYGVGLALGLAIRLAGWWERGAAWERDALVLAHETVTPALDPLFLWLPYIGTNYSLVPIIAIAAVLLWRRGRRMIALHLATVQLGSWTLNPAVKFTIPRPRPDLFELRGQYAFPAYPSGHSIAVVAVLFTVAYVLWRTGHGRWPFVVVSIFFLINSYSRLYLSVHWPTDLIGGAVVGAIWLAATLAAFHPQYDRTPRRGWGR